MSTGCGIRIKICNLLNPEPEPCPRATALLMESFTKCSSEIQAGQGDCYDRVKKLARRRWTEAEDALLVQLVRDGGPRAWSERARLFDRRTGPQLRARWVQVLSEETSCRAFSAEEDQHILKTQRKYGNRWVFIGSTMENRTGTSVRNRFNALTKQARMSIKQAGEPSSPTESGSTNDMHEVVPEIQI
mmetsp:Transcript_14356/g.30933  ORF Transcript_14356/g.30933 Transcript_14356/m.30933 type:complete len:188 (-) Transcript_14356:756-1319(-)